MEYFSFYYFTADDSVQIAWGVALICMQLHSFQYQVEGKEL